jgi:hypothetical protein
MGLFGGEGHDLAVSQEPAQLSLPPSERLTWATTGAVVTGTTPASSRTQWSAHTTRSLRSAAMSAPAS